MIYRNIHSHVFTMNNAPKNFLHLFLPWAVADAVDTITNTTPGTKVLSRLISVFGNGGKRYASFLRIGKSKDQLTVFQELMQQYSDKNMQFVALTLNMEYLGAGSSNSLFEGQLQEVIEIKRQYPDNIILFLGIDPRWLNGNPVQIRNVIKAKFDTKIDTAGGERVYPFAGLKIYPSTGFYVFDQRLKDTFEWAAAEGVPVLSHTSYLGGIFNYNRNTIIQNLNAFNPYTNTFYTQPKYKSGMNVLRWLAGSNENTLNRRNCSYFLEPDTYSSVLEYFENKGKPLKICLAHFGGYKQVMAAVQGTKDSEQATPYGVLGQNWFTQIQNLLTKYKGAYTDISYDVAVGATNSNQSMFKAFYNEVNNPDYGKKVLFGTDYFMAEQECPETETYNKFRNFAANEKLSNYNNVPMWDKIAGSNTSDFLKSSYFS